MEKVKIVICDDDKKAAEILQNCIKQLCSEESIFYSIDYYSDGEMFLSRYKEEADIIFMDIEMPLLDGLNTAKILRNQDDQVTLVFTTSHEKYAVKGYEVSAYRYLMKPIDYVVFKKEMAPKFRAIIHQKSSVLYFKTESGAESICPSEILYIETLYNHKLSIHCQRKVLEVYKNMSEFEEKLDHALFFRCHTSYIVNFSAIVKIDKNEIFMRDQKSIPLSKYRRKEFMERFMHYIQEVF